MSGKLLRVNSQFLGALVVNWLGLFEPYGASECLFCLSFLLDFQGSFQSTAALYSG